MLMKGYMNFDILYMYLHIGNIISCIWGAPLDDNMFFDHSVYIHAFIWLVHVDDFITIIDGN